MPDPRALASGHYLKELRRRRGLSLLDVCRLADGAARRVDKATLSRVEHGHQHLGLSTLIALAPIYRVPPEVLLERVELDTELERLGVRATSAMTQAELIRAGRRALLQENRKWEAYACFRDALRANGDEIDPAYRDPQEQRTNALLNLATVMRSLGKQRLALFELRELESQRALSPERHAILLDRISNCHRCLGDRVAALRYAKAAQTQAEEVREHQVLAYALCSVANVAFADDDLEETEEYLRRAFRTHRECGQRNGAVTANPAFEVNVLLRLADVALRLGRHERAGRIAIGARDLGRRLRQPAGQAYAAITLGEVEERLGNGERAMQRWRAAARIASRLADRRLEFWAEFCVYRRELRQGSRSLAGASRRRLERLAPWVPAHLPILSEFRNLADQASSTV